MKCISCGTDNDLRDRTANQGRCKNCHHQFAFEPSEVTDNRFGFTDPFFAKLISDISANNTLYFTPRQLFYLVNRRLSSRLSATYVSLNGFFVVLNLVVNGFLALFSIIIGDSAFLIVWFLINLCFILFHYKQTQTSKLSYRVRLARTSLLKVIGALILSIGILVSLAMSSYPIFIASVFLGMLSLYLGSRPLKNQAQTFLITENQFQDWLTRWQQINSIDKILPSPREELAPASVSPDISVYSFDRAVICDSAAIAQLLIANNFHFENNCAVLSITGYPQSIFSTVLEMLSRNPDLKVYAIHDASPRGVSLVHQLRTSPNWFQNRNVMIYDLGLLPRHILSSKSMFILASEESAQQATELPQEVRQSLSSDEIKWLESGNFVELESFSPQRIIQVLTQGINRSQEITSSGDSLVIVDDVGYGSTGYIYTVESFG